eukprot:scaffold6708_cov134-Cylindrotheca_fusiformis.AAC.17
MQSKPRRFFNTGLLLNHNPTNKSKFQAQLHRIQGNYLPPVAYIMSSPTVFARHQKAIVLSLVLFASCWIELVSAFTRSTTFEEATLIKPASPIRNSSSRTVAAQQLGLSYARRPESPTQLQAKKKKTAPAATKKVQVKLLKHVAGSGQAGEVILVTPAFFNNKLRPMQAAEMISDEEVAEELAKKEAKEKEERAKAEELKETLDAIALQLKRKAGPDGQLFGGIGPKTIMSELQAEVNDDYLNNKWVKVTEVLNEDGKKIRGDIKHTGDFGAKISLLSGISAKIDISVEAEE